MEIKTEKQEILKRIGLGVNISSSRATTLPILNNLLLETEGNSLKITATDMEVGVVTKTPVEVIEEGSVTVPARKIFDILKELPEGVVGISASKNHTVSIKAGKSFFKVMGLDKGEYPKFQNHDFKNAVSFDQSTLKEALQLTCFAASHDETRYVLNGVLISVQGKEVKFVSTDGRRLAYFKKTLPIKAAQNFEVIVPLKATGELLKLLDWDGEILVEATKNKIIFKSGETIIQSSLIEGKFPNYDQVIPKNKTSEAVINRQEFLQAVRRAALLTSVEAPALKLDFLKDKLILSAKTPNMGEAKEEVGMELKGKEVTIGFNPQYLLDVLKALDSETIQILLTESDKPGIVSGREDYIYVIMPMQIT